MAYYIPNVWKSGGTRPPCPPPNYAHWVQPAWFASGDCDKWENLLLVSHKVREPVLKKFETHQR